MKSFALDKDETEDFLSLIERDRENVERVIRRVREDGIEINFRVHARADTVDDSVKHSDFDRNQIVKTLVFSGDDYFAVMAPGDKRVDEDVLKEIRGSDIEMASPGEVEKETGYVIGGVSPFDLEMDVYIDASILRHDKVRPAAGSRVIGAEIDPEDLKDITEAERRNLTE